MKLKRQENYPSVGWLRRGVASVTLLGATSLAGWGFVQLVDGVFFSTPKADAYASGSTSDPGFIRDAKAQAQDVMQGLEHFGEGVPLGIGTLLIEDLGIPVLVASIGAAVRQALAEDGTRQPAAAPDAPASFGSLAEIADVPREHGPFDGHAGMPPQAA